MTKNKKFMSFLLSLAMLLGVLMPSMMQASLAASSNPYPYWQSFYFNGVQYQIITCTYYTWDRVYRTLGIARGEMGAAGRAMPRRLDTRLDRRPASAPLRTGFPQWKIPGAMWRMSPQSGTVMSPTMRAAPLTGAPTLSVSTRVIPCPTDTPKNLMGTSI